MPNPKTKTPRERALPKRVRGGLAWGALLVSIVLAYMTVGCSKKAVSDDALTTDIQSKLYADAVTKPASITVAVKDGVVTLSGDVPSSDVEAEAMKVANGTAGVKSVTDQMTVNGAAASNQPSATPSEQPQAPGNAPAPGPEASSNASPATNASPASYISQPAPASEDPPSRVARLSYIQGSVSMEPAGVNDWAPAVINRPFTTGDYLYTDQGGQAELHLDVAVLRMGSQTSFGFLNLNDHTAQIKLTEGEMCFRLHDFGGNEGFEVDTPNGALTLLSNGMYRIGVDANGNSSLVVVRQGQARITGGGQAFTLNAGESVNLSGTDQMTYNVERAPGPDQFENWCNQREGRHAGVQSARYVPPTVVGYEDLDDYGSWQQAPNYGAVWYPKTVQAGWAPYHNGHWAWVEPWGWTWVDDAPWGFAPFHYGRWAYVSGRWGWCPGPISVAQHRGPVERPYYAPALVAFFGGAHWGVSVSAGAGPTVGWVPLGYGEVYKPPYRVSQNYFKNVNVANTTVNKNVNITNVYKTTYINQTTNITNTKITNNNVVNNNQRYVNMSAPNAVMAMPHSAFAGGRPVAQAARPVPAAEVAKIQPSTAEVLAPRIAPTRQAVIPTLGSRPAPHPPAQIVQRAVVARTAPPPPVTPFAAREQYLQQHAGQPHDFAAMHQAVAPRAAPVAYVRPAPAAKQVQVHPGMRVTTAAVNRPPTPAAATSARPAAAEAPSRRPPAAEAKPATAPAAGRNPAQPSRGAPAAAREAAPAHPAAHATPPAPAGRGTPPNVREAKPAQPAARPNEPSASHANPAARHAPEPARPPAHAAPTKPEPRATERTPAARAEAKPEPGAHGTPPNHSQQHPARGESTSTKKETNPPR